MTNENAEFRRICLNLITFRGTKILSFTHHGNERAVSILSGEIFLFCGLYLSLLSAHCSPWWTTATQPICCADSGWTDSLPDLSAYTNTVSWRTSDLQYIFVLLNNPGSSYPDPLFCLLILTAEWSAWCCSTFI